MAKPCGRNQDCHAHAREDRNLARRVHQEEVDRPFVGEERPNLGQQLPVAGEGAFQCRDSRAGSGSCHTSRTTPIQRHQGRDGACVTLSEHLQPSGAARKRQRELAASRPEQYKIFLLGALAGLRRNEIDVLPWTAFRWKGVIRIETTEFYRPKSHNSEGDVLVDPDRSTGVGSTGPTGAFSSSTFGHNAQP
jgi:hypothetical protein